MGRLGRADVRIFKINAPYAELEAEMSGVFLDFFDAEISLRLVEKSDTIDAGRFRAFGKNPAP